MSTNRFGTGPIAILPGFFPQETLWTGDSPLFPSKQSAKWFLRKSRQQLVEHKAIAIHLGCVVIHIERLVQVAEAQALKAAQ